MKLIIGLGNPGKEYEKTRHNAGFLFLDFLKQTFRCETFHLNTKMSAEISSGVINGEKILLIKPAGYMNASGTTVQALMHFYKFSVADIVIIHDDLDIAPGLYKTTVSSRAAGHNGVQDIIDKLGTQSFFRVRIGIGRPPEGAQARIAPHDFVLQNFSEEEIHNLSNLFPKITDEIVQFTEKRF